MENTLTSFLTSLGDIVTAVFGWCGDAIDFIMANPIIYVPLLGFFVVGGAVGILMRVMRG